MSDAALTNDKSVRPERESANPSRQITGEGSLTPNNLSTIHGLEQSRALPSAFTSNEKLLGQLNPQEGRTDRPSTNNNPPKPEEWLDIVGVHPAPAAGQIPDRGSNESSFSNPGARRVFEQALRPSTNNNPPRPEEWLDVIGIHPEPTTGQIPGRGSGESSFSNPEERYDFAREMLSRNNECPNCQRGWLPEGVTPIDLPQDPEERSRVLREIGRQIDENIRTAAPGATADQSNSNNGTRRPDSLQDLLVAMRHGREEMPAESTIDRGAYERWRNSPEVRNALQEDYFDASVLQDSQPMPAGLLNEIRIREYSNARENRGQSSITPDGAIRPDGATTRILDQLIAEGKIQTVTPEEAARSIEAHQRFHENQGEFLRDVHVLAALQQMNMDKPGEQTPAEQSRNNSRAREIKANVAQDVINQRIENLDGPNSEKTKAVARAILNGELDDAAAAIKKMSPEDVAAMGTTLSLAFRDSGISVSKASYAGKDRFEQGLIFSREGSTSALMLTTEEGRDPLIGNIVSKPGEKEKLKFDQNADRFDKDTLMGAIAVTAINNITNKVEDSLLDEKSALARQFSPNGAMADRNKDGQISASELMDYRNAMQDPIEQRKLDALIHNFNTVAGSDEKISREDAETRKTKIMEQGTVLAVANSLTGKPMSNLPDLLYGALYSDAKANEFQNAINRKLSETGARVEIDPAQIDNRQNETRQLRVIGRNNNLISRIDIPVRRSR